MKTKKPYVWVEQAVVISAMRKSFRRYPPYKQVRDRCKREWFQLCKNGNKRRRVHFQCETCGEKVSAKQFAVDHTEPVVSTTEGFVDYNTYAKRLFCSVDNLSGMCHACHRVKSTSETRIRAKSRKENNEQQRKSTSRAA